MPKYILARPLIVTKNMRKLHSTATRKSLSIFGALPDAGGVENCFRQRNRARRLGSLGQGHIPLRRLCRRDFWHKAKAFRPKANGEELVWVEPAFDEAGELNDLIWHNSECEWGFSTGRAHMLGAEQLKARVYTSENPLLVTDNPICWLDDGKPGLCLLRKCARSELRQAAFIRCDSFDLVEVIAAEIFRRGRARALSRVSV